MELTDKIKIMKGKDIGDNSIRIFKDITVNGYGVPKYELWVNGEEITHAFSYIRIEHMYYRLIKVFKDLDKKMKSEIARLKTKCNDEVLEVYEMHIK